MSLTRRVGRPHMPSSYGIQAPTDGAGLLPWTFVTSRMEASRNYWIASASSDGRPHAAPVWGLWHKEAFFFSTDRNSRKGKNVAVQPQIAVHLESGDEVVIVDGEAEPVDDSVLLAELDELYFLKYGFHLDAGLTFRVTPRVVLAWRERDYPGSATRWVIGQ